MPTKVRTNPRKQASQDRSRATVSAILRATARVLIRDGYDRASTNRIAAQAGVSVGSLYQYFPSKEALVAALAAEHAQEIATLLQAEMQTMLAAPLEQAIERVVRLMVEAHAIHPQLHKVLAEEVPRFRGGDGMMRDVEDEMVRLARAVLSARKGELALYNARASAREQEEALDLAAFMVVTLIESLTHRAVLHRQDLLGERFVREVTKLVTGYLRQ
ncbi:MAG: TetR/AcrR family transcriptional regulator [Myxococcales bacterium]